MRPKSFPNTLVNSFKEFLHYALILLFLFILTGFIEVIYDMGVHGTPQSLGSVLMLGLVKEILFFFETGLLLYLPFLLFYLISRDAAKVFFIVLSIALILIQLSLSKYFITTLALLGSDFWSYSGSDIKETVNASGSLNFFTVFMFVVVAVLIVLCFKYLKPKIKLNEPFDFLMFILFCIAAVFVSSSINEKWLPGQDQLSNDLSVNKSWYFYTHSSDHFFPESHELSIYSDNFFGPVPIIVSDSSYIAGGAPSADSTQYTRATVTGDTSKTGLSGTPGPQGITAIAPQLPISYPDPGNYPFLHTINSKLDVLSPFFNRGSRAPNIVVILVEGLGRAFTNRGAYLGNFTPFIDSLAHQSLYWENFLSEGGRTFAVMPSFLGSLPFAKNGFNELGENMPKHFSLLSLLKSNGYSSHFYYGGDSHFDNMDVYMKKNNISSINDLNNFPGGYEKMPSSSSGFSWGYGDKELFRRYLATEHPSSTPSVTVFMTLSTHSPFLINNQEYYLQRVEQRMTELGFNDSRKNEARNYKNQYATILYTDDAIRYFINSYKQRADYHNTVFIISGDHRMPEIPMSTKIDRYHVPLIIFSPMLRRTAIFESISTHFDVTPSVLMWLKNSYGIKLPAMTHWMGDGLDTNRSFRNIHAYPLMQTKSTLIDFIMGEYMLNDNNLFHITPTMYLNPEQNPAKSQQLDGEFNIFKRKNDRFINGAKLVPDSLIQKYLPR